MISASKPTMLIQASTRLASIQEAEGLEDCSGQLADLAFRSRWAQSLYSVGSLAPNGAACRALRLGA
jgi:hypothetical protein